jgi:hypothetical protein
MNCFFRAFPVVLLLLVSSIGNAQSPEYVPGDLMVMLEPGASAQQIASDLRTIDGVNTGAFIDRELSAPMRTWLLKFDANAISQQRMLKMVSDHKDVMLVQNNHIVKERIVPNDTQYGQQWHHQNIASESAWDITTGGVTATGDTIVVCIIENSDLPHADLIDNAWFNFDEIPNNGIDDDLNGYVDDRRGWNPPGNNDNVYGGSHGTQVAGMIGATGDNSMGVVGANWDVKMMVVDYGGVQESEVVAAYTYPLVMRRLYNETNGERGAFVVATNASWGIDNGQPSNAPIWCAMYDTLGTAGILSCGATANNNVNIDVVGDLPTACPSEYLVSVTATDEDDMRTFSAYGITHVDVGAPGDDVRTTSIGGGYGSTSGTSFASPLTAGVIGLLYSAPCATMMSLVHSDPAAGALYVRDALFDGVDQAGNLPGQTATGGRINSSNSLELIMAGCGPCPAPYDLAVEFNGGSSILSWAFVNTGTFTVQYRPVGTSTWTDVTGLATNELELTDLQACTEYEFQVMVDCGDDESGFSDLFTWISEGCCSTPAELSAGNITEDGATVSWDNVFAAETYTIQYRPIGATEWTEVSGITLTEYVLTGLTNCAGYEVQVLSECADAGSGWSASVEFTTIGCGSCVDLDYCASSSEDSSDEHLESVTLNTINNVSGNDGGYGDYTSMSTQLIIGNTYSLTMVPGFSGSTFQEHYRVWIDLDQNGLFTDAGEMVYDAPSTTSSPVTTNITIPASATAGFSRMRIVMKYNSAVSGPCTDGYNYGETEDYCVQLMAPNTSVQEIPGIAVNVFPDPADRDIFFDLSGTGIDGVNTITILDNSGRVVATKNLVNGRATVSTAFLADGMYIYRIDNAGKELVRGKFIVEHL